MKRHVIFGLVALALALNLAVGARLYLNTAAAVEKDSPYPQLELFSLVMERIRKDYVDGKDLTYETLVHSAIKGMMQQLDPHSEFLEPDEYRDLQDDTQGQFGGLGIVVSIKDNVLTVVAPMEDTPGWRAGIMAGDRIVRIDGQSTERMTLPEAVKRLRGQPGTQVTITIHRPSTGITRELTLTRAVISVNMVRDINGRQEFPLDQDKIGYIRITQFGERTAEELEDALQKLRAQGMTGLILDLRWNPGGLLEQAVAVCSKFLPRGQLIVSTEGRGSVQKFTARGRGDELNRMPMVVLVNVGSASAAEIVAGCLQDTRRAVILGETTFGKGSVQSILPLPQGAALRLTTAKYYTPSHKVIHERGITPDIEVIMSDEEERAAFARRSPGGFEALDPAERERLAKLADTQLERARDLLRGITLFTQRAPEPLWPQRGAEKMAAR